MKCMNCNRALKMGVPCRCRKGAVESESPRPAHIWCCVEGCTNSANVRIWTAKGWQNVCAKVIPGDTRELHYGTIEAIPRVTHNPVMEDLRSAYKDSPDYRARNRGPA